MRNDKNLRGAIFTLAAACAPMIVSGTAMADVFNLPAGETSVVMVPVGNPGNAPDPFNPMSAPGGFGSVSYSYNIGEYDVTASQYTAFLNAVAATDTYGLYNASMGSPAFLAAACGIAQSGSPGSYTYATTKNGNLPVSDVSWGDAARFCNWLTNGQPTGVEGNGTTETGSYTLNGATTNAALMTITRNANADYVIPTENEWYKAAYYDPLTGSYYRYPTQSNSMPSNVQSATGTNNADFLINGPGFPTPVGSFAASPGPYGTFDQGGDVMQWNESAYSDTYRGLRGGSFDTTSYGLYSGLSNVAPPAAESADRGFRVSQVPEPMSSAGFVIVGTVGLLRRRHRRGRGVK